MEVKITSQDHFGRGIAKTNKIIFVNKALPDEIVDINIYHETKNYCEASCINVITSSKDRSEPLCPYYTFCGGCQILHQKYISQLLFKQNKIREILNKFSKINNLIINPIISGRQFNYRNKVVFHIKNNSLGLYEEKTNTIIPINNCLLLDEGINVCLKELNNNLKNNLSNIKEIMLKKAIESKQVLLSIEGNVSKNVILNNINLLNYTTIVLNNKIIYGHGLIIETINNMDFFIAKDSFFQVNHYITKRLYNKIIEDIKGLNINNALDLYCGVGTITLLISPYVNHVLGIEVVESAINNALLNKKINNINNVDFILGKVEEKIDKINQNIDLIIVDPPRRGLDNRVFSTIEKLLPKVLIYISCDPVTLARDLEKITKIYDLKEIQPFDMFPNTNHVECVCVLNRR